MDVYLVPLGGDRYELYCEVADDEIPDAEATRGLVRRIGHQFRAMMTRASQARRQQQNPADSPDAEGARTWTRRVADRALAWVAEKIAEQRLLWHLRKQHEVTLVHPDDLAALKAMTIVQASLKRDFERHRLWFIVDAIGFIASGLFVLVPGPNIIAYYFAFRLVGHYLSMHGARHGRRRVVWHTQASAPLTELRQAAGLAPPLRERHVRDIASDLRLQHLAAFFERIVIRSA